MCWNLPWKCTPLKAKLGEQALNEANFVIFCSLSSKKKILLVIKHATNQNQLKPPTTTQNYPEPARTVQNQPKLSETIHNQPKPPSTSQNYPQTAKTTQKQSQSIKTLHKFSTQLKGVYHELSSTEKPYFSVMLIWE